MVGGCSSEALANAFTVAASRITKTSTLERKSRSRAAQRPVGAWTYRLLGLFAGNWEGRDGKNRPDRGGQRAEYEALSRSVGSAWLSDLGHQQRLRGARSCPQASSRSYPHGYPASAGIRP